MRQISWILQSDDKNASKLAETVLTVFNSFSDVNNLSWTYDRAAVMARKLNGVQRKLKDAGFPNIY